MSRRSKRATKDLKIDRGTGGGGGGSIEEPEVDKVEVEAPENEENRLEQMIQNYEEDLRDRFDRLQEKYGDEPDEAQQAKLEQAGQIIVDFGKKANEIVSSTEEDLSTIDAKATKVEEAHSEAQKEIKSLGKLSMGQRWGSFLEKAKGVKSALTKPSELRGVIGKTAYDTVGSVLGVKFVGDLFLALGKKGDIYNYFSEKKQVKKDKAEILDAFMKEMGEEQSPEAEAEEEAERSEEVVAEAENYKQKIEASNLDDKDKKVLLEGLEKVLNYHDKENENLNKEKQEFAKKLLGTYFKTKIKGTKIAKDAMNTAMVATGLFAARGLMYGVMAAAERGQKASDSFAKQRLTREIQGPEVVEAQGPIKPGEEPLTVEASEQQESKLKFILRDMIVNATRENYRALMLKGAEGDGENKKKDFVKAAGNLMRLAGIGAMSITAFSDSGILDTNSVQKMLEAAKENGIANLGDTAKVVSSEVGQNFVKNADKIIPGDLSKDKEIVDGVDKAVEAGISGQVADASDPFNLGAGVQMEATPPTGSTMDHIEALYDEPMPNIDASETETPEIGQFADVPASSELTEEVSGPLEDIIKTEEGQSADSIWRSTKNIITNNPERFGYEGDPTDTAALSQWAETQTANLVNALNTEQGGNLADLVHDGDKVIINFDGDKPVLSFEASSGIEASHLADDNVDAFFMNRQWEEGVEHCVEIDEATGDQYYEIDASDGTYKVYDWDRDANPNVIFPDGHAEEMSADQLNILFQEKNIFMSDQEVTAAEQEAIQDAAKRSVDQFLSGESKYSEDLYAEARSSGKLNEVFHKLLSTEDKTKITPFIEDHFKANNLSDNQLNIFLRYVYANQELANFDGSPADLVQDFEAQAITNFDDLKSGNAGIWRIVKVGDQYALAQKYHTGIIPFRSDHYFVDLNGDGNPDPIGVGINGEAEEHLDHDAMKSAFSKGFINQTSAAQAEGMAQPPVEDATRAPVPDKEAMKDHVRTIATGGFGGGESEVPEPADQEIPESKVAPEQQGSDVEKEKIFKTSKASYRGTSVTPEPAEAKPDFGKEMPGRGVGTTVSEFGGGESEVPEPAAEVPPASPDDSNEETRKIIEELESTIKTPDTPDTPAETPVVEETEPEIPVRKVEFVPETSVPEPAVETPEAPAAEELAPEEVEIPAVLEDLEKTIQTHLGEKYSVGQDGLDCMTFIRELAKDNPDSPVLQDYLSFMQSNKGADLNFENFFAQQDSGAVVAEHADWPSVKSDLPAGQYLVNFASPGHPDGIYGPESHGGILQVTEDASGNKDFSLSHASTASLGVEGQDQPVPLNTLKIEADGQTYEGRDIVEGFRKAYADNITDQPDGSRVYDSELVAKTKFFDADGNELKPSLESDGSIRLGHVVQESDLDSYFTYNQDFSRDISVMNLDDRVSMAVASLNEGDKNLDFNLGKIASADLDYLTKVKQNSEAMLVALKLKEGGPEVQRLADGYKSVLAAVEKQINNRA